MLTFRHSGKLGDIIYSLPTVKALGGGIFYVDHQTQYLEKQPLGREAATMMVELLQTQAYIAEARLYAGERISHDLDRFRHRATPMHVYNHAVNDVKAGLFGGLFMGLLQHLVPKLELNLPQLHWQCAGLSREAVGDGPWLTGIDELRVADIVISKTTRHSGRFDWSVLESCRHRSVFVGLEHEWKSFCRDHFVVEFYQVANLVELARVIAGARLFAGNQSFGLSIADAMSIPRAVQLWELSPNSLETGNAHSFISKEILDRYLD